MLRLAVYLALVGVAFPAAADVNFSRDIRPLLSQKCFHCHGPDEGDRQVGLRLDAADGEEGAYRELAGVSAILPGDPEASEVWRRIASTDKSERMPPLDSHLDPLTVEQQELVRRWIEEGANYERFWSFTPPKRVGPKSPVDNDWSGKTIDRFVLDRLDEEGLSPNERADKRTLIRRVTLDLTGLPPTLSEIQEFVADQRPDAYDRLVDRLLASPHYGEHMARYWLDLVRFADTNGRHHDHYREMTPYRDWVIRAFNDNLPFDDFTRYQIAGDLLDGADGDGPSTDQLIASGFNRLHLIIDVGTALPEESFFNNVVDRVSAVGTAFMGLTLQCASCHDHKYDPIKQKDFYQLYAFFNNFDGAPETGGRGTEDFARGLQPPYLELPTPKQSAELGRLAAEIAAAEADLDRLKAQQHEAADAPLDQVITTADAGDAVAAAEKRLKDLRERRKRVTRKVPATLVMRERDEPRPAYVMIRGAYDNPGERVERDVPAFLPVMKPTDSLRTRRDLAEWLVDPGNPLTARVTVNRFWQQFFGVGLVKTSEDFGAQGEWPSHPELLDRLALDFVESGWDVKSLVRAIVLSAAYQQDSRAPREQYRQDPRNRLLARGSRYRLDAEVIRDQLLSISGLLNTQMYGKSIRFPQPDGLWKIVTMPSSNPRTFRADEGDAIYRRSVYAFWKRGLPPPQMTIFDAPNRDSCIARRERTNTPLQALLLMNEELHFAAARSYAQQLNSREDLSPEQRLATAYEAITAQKPEPEVREKLIAAWRDFRTQYRDDPRAANELLADAQIPTEERAELAADTMVIHSLFNLDAAKTRE
ncbi:Planctomycete cytochrome C [Posidoniimonas corsicana]|uniref:Planctomycete cytochrome C n=1 Tax=Posidoniimonas corsicana TaxID=1938618 RepID=A0A5C5VEI3_9BACT|nr:PSD1 and planctomycete cytochrome C domain-containing protein [Posidoniimonas corsicana]TWT36561.1 Planctomycete cytochrome C [Posidoniimonas corsicana]